MGSHSATSLRSLLFHRPLGHGGCEGCEGIQEYLERREALSDELYHPRYLTVIMKVLI